MKLCIFTPKISEEADLIKAAAENMGVECRKAKLLDTYIENNGEEFIFAHRKFDLLDYDAFLFRPFTKNLNKGLLAARYLHDNDKVIIDDCLYSGRCSSFFTSYSLSKAGIPIYPQTISDNLNTSRDVLMEMEHPIIMKYDLPGEKPQVVYSDDWTESYDLVRTSKGRNYLFRKASKINYFYQIYIIGEEIIGAVKKTPMGNDFKLNFSDKLNQEVIECPDEVKEISLNATKALGYDIASVDVVEEEGKLYILDVNRAPRFVKFQVISEIDFASKIVEFVKSKAEKN